MYTRMSAVAKRGVTLRGAAAYAVYEAFITAMLADPQRAQVYEAAPLYPEREWEYPLRVTHPQDAGVMLEYMVSAFRLGGNVGFLVIYYPKTSALEATEAMNSLFVEQYGEGNEVILG